MFLISRMPISHKYDYTLSLTTADINDDDMERFLKRISRYARRFSVYHVDENRTVVLLSVYEENGFDNILNILKEIIDNENMFVEKRISFEIRDEFINTSPVVLADWYGNVMLDDVIVLGDVVAVRYGKISLDRRNFIYYGLRYNRKKITYYLDKCEYYDFVVDRIRKIVNWGQRVITPAHFSFQGWENLFVYRYEYEVLLQDERMNGKP